MDVWSEDEAMSNAEERPPLVDQPTWKPTRKMFWTVVVAVLSVGLQRAVAAYLPGMDWLNDPALQGWPSVIVGGIVGYFVRDESNA